MGERALAVSYVKGQGTARRGVALYWRAESDTAPWELQQTLPADDQPGSSLGGINLVSLSSDGKLLVSAYHEVLQHTTGMGSRSTQLSSATHRPLSMIFDISLVS